MSEKLEETKVALDFLENVIEPGALIVYPSMVGQSPRLTLAEVLDVKYGQARYHKWSIKVQPLSDSWGGDYRFEQWRKNKDSGTYEKVAVKAKAVTLHFPNRMMVIT